MPWHKSLLPINRIYFWLLGMVFAVPFSFGLNS
jgi:hypothetical protein